MKKLLFLLIITGLALPGESAGQTDTTDIVVRAVAKDAKFIGTSMGGAYVAIKEVKSGKILAEGVTKGSTGDTDKLVRDARQRYEKLSTAGAAKFEASLTIEEPTFVEVTVTGPLAQRQSQVSSSIQLWLIPGKDITGDGLLLEIPGFAVDILQPQAHEVTGQKRVSITANAVMMCGCSISPGGLWDSNEMEFTAIIEREGREVARKEMKFTGKNSTFQAFFTPPESGAYQIIVYGYDPRTGNTGLDRTTFISNR